MGGPSASVRFQSRAHNGLFPAEPIAVPRSLLNIEFAALLPKLLAEFWPAVRDDVEGVPEAMPEGVEAVTFTVNEKRAPKNGSLSEIVDDDERLDIVVFIKGADDYTFWISEEKIKHIRTRGDAQAGAKKRKVESDDSEHARRKIKRWETEETKLLVDLVTEWGKGKWKKVLELGAGIFDKHRTTVDLKDKWRNLERSGAAPILPENSDTKRTVRSKKKPEEVPAYAVNSIPVPSANIQAMAAEVKAGTLAPDQLVASLIGSQMRLGAYPGSMPTDQTTVTGTMTPGIPFTVSNSMQLPVLHMDPSHLPPSNPPILQTDTMSPSVAIPVGGVPLQSMVTGMAEVAKNPVDPQSAMSDVKQEDGVPDQTASAKGRKDNRARATRTRGKSGKEH